MSGDARGVVLSTLGILGGLPLQQSRAGARRSRERSACRGLQKPRPRAAEPFSVLSSRRVRRRMTLNGAVGIHHRAHRGHRERGPSPRSLRLTRVVMHACAGNLRISTLCSLWFNFRFQDDCIGRAESTCPFRLVRSRYDRLGFAARSAPRRGIEEIPPREPGVAAHGEALVPARETTAQGTGSAGESASESAPAVAGVEAIGRSTTSTPK